MNNLSNNFFYFITGMLFGGSYIYLLEKKKIHLLNNEVNLLKNKISYLEEKNFNLIDHLMYLDSSPYDSYNYNYYKNTNKNNNNINNNNNTEYITINK